jgi:hypothetical protein
MKYRFAQQGIFDSRHFVSLGIVGKTKTPGLPALRWVCGWLLGFRVFLVVAAKGGD